MMIEIREADRDKILGILKRNPGKYLRIVIEGTGCAGPYLGLSLDEAGQNEVVTRVNGLDILISDDVKKYAEASTINVFLNPDGKDLE
jgi:Fe-S cluster assembly iron-binding protein IscA